MNLTYFGLTILIMSDVIPFEWSRLLFGDGASLLLLLEFVARSAVIFLWLLFLIRLTGKRGLSQLSPLEFAIVIALGTAAGDPMIYAEVPLLPAMVVIALVIGLQRSVSSIMLHNRTFETFVDGSPVELVRDGVIQTDNLRKARFTQEDLFERLRPEGIYQLGQVKHVYLEQGAQLSVFEFGHEEKRAGLPIVPPWSIQSPPPVTAGFTGAVACKRCASVRQGSHRPCQCGVSDWTQARMDLG